MELYGKTSQESGPKAEKGKIERTTGLAEEQKRSYRKVGIKLVALRFQTGGDTSEIPGLTSGVRYTYKSTSHALSVKRSPTSASSFKRLL